MALSKALLNADEVGDGYLTKEQFFEAVKHARIDIGEENLEAIFEKIGSKFEKS